MDRFLLITTLVSTLVASTLFCLTISIGFNGSVPIGIKNFKDALEIIQFAAVTAASIFAIKAYSTWKQDKQVDWDKNFKEVTSSDIYKCEYLLLNLLKIVHELSDTSIHTRVYINENCSIKWPKKPQEHNFQIYYDAFSNKERISLKAEKMSISEDYKNAIIKFEKSAYEFTSLVHELHRQFSDILYDNSAPLQMRLTDLEEYSRDEKIKELHDNYSRANRLLIEIFRYKVI